MIRRAIVLLPAPALPRRMIFIKERAYPKATSLLRHGAGKASDLEQTRHLAVVCSPPDLAE